MEKMYFTQSQPDVRVVKLPIGKRDVTVLTNEQIVTMGGEEGGTPSDMYQYDGNIFRTVYELTEDDIRTEKEKYLDYDPSGEPTLEQLQRERDLIDNYTLQLIEEGVI